MVSEKPRRTPLPVLLVFSPNGWMDGETNSQMAVSLMSSLFANIVAAKFTVMQRYLE